MKKSLKIILISLASLLIVLLIAVSLTLWVVFKPEKLTPIVQKQADKLIDAHTEIGKVELTFFSTFPHFGLKINQIIILNPIQGSPNDTLVGIEKLVATIDFMAWWKRGDMILNELELANGSINIYVDSLGISNYDIYSSTQTTAGEDEIIKVESGNSTPFRLDLEQVRFNNINIAYIDHTFPMVVVADSLNANIEGSLFGMVFKGKIVIDKGQLTFEYDGDRYLDAFSTKLNIETELDIDQYVFTFKTFTGFLNEVDLTMKGFVEYQSQNGNTVLDLDYQIRPSELKKVLDLVPSYFRHYYEGFIMNGTIASSGTVKGIYNNLEMPFVDVKAQLGKGELAYDGLPLKLEDVMAEVSFVSDLMTDERTWLYIERFDAKTQKSTISSKGMVNELFSDINCDLISRFELQLDEFAPLLPTDMKIGMSGKATGNVKSVFTYTQIENLEIEKMKLSGSLTLNGLDVIYDTISVSSSKMNVEFALPNPVPLSPQTGFAYLRLNIDQLNAGLDESTSVFLNNGLFIAEISDARDSSRIPDVLCSFRVGSLFGSMDSITMEITDPMGRVKLMPREDKPLQPKIELVYSNEMLEAGFGSEQAEVNRIIFNGTILNDNGQEDVFLQWLVSGSIDFQGGNFHLTALNDKVEIPSIKMDFDPENIKIEKGKLIVGPSDFQLTGSVKNLLSYYRGDSVLRADLSFVSNNTDVTQIMGLTSGIGYEDEKNKDEEVKPSGDENAYTGPYMVPKGLDIILNTNIMNASFGDEAASNIRGQVRLYDGTLMLDEIKLTTPAARMQLTAMYRTPRKNHLFLGIDYHMLDVEIAELLRMIPDIDSLMPMLRSFGGEGEFHMAVETYLDSMYNVKMSTLRGAASISGQDLVLMDGETFSEIAKTLRFSKQAQNKVDSISAEFTIFREEIDIYPFMVVMDKYKAVVSGRHNFDMSFDYHISLVDSPLPIKLGVDVRGTLDDLKIRPAACKYGEFYRPSARGAVQNRQLELRRMIRESLTQKVTD